MEKGKLSFASNCDSKDSQDSVMSPVKHDYLDGEEKPKAKHLVDLVKRFNRYGYGNSQLEICHEIDRKPAPTSEYIDRDEYQQTKKSLLESDPEQFIMESDWPVGKILDLATNSLLDGYKAAERELLWQSKALSGKGEKHRSSANEIH